jgi:hypothetical protein
MTDTLARLVIRLEAEASRLINELERSRRTTERYARESKKSTDVVAAGFSKLQAVATVALGAIGSVKLVDTLAEFDKLNASLKTVTGSLESAGAAGGMLKRFSTETPFELSEVTQAFIKLRMLGLDASEKSLRSFGNTAAAMGKPLDQFIEAVADAATGEFERLKEFGIKASQEGEKVTLTFRGTSTTIRNESQAITAYLTRLGETDFAAGMSDQMDTIGGRLSNLSDAFSNFIDFIGNLGVRDVLKASFAGAAEFLGDFQKRLNAMFGTGLQSQLDAYDLRIASLHNKISDQKQSIRESPLISGFLGSEADLRRDEQTLAEMSGMREKIRQSIAESERKNQDLLKAATTSPASSGGGSGSKKSSDAEAKKAAQDQIQILEAQFAEFKANLDRERQVMDASMALELERAANNAEQKLEIERRYQGNASVLKQEEIKAEIELKKRVDALNQDRGESAKLLAEANTLEKDLIATQKLAGIEAETLGEKAKNAARGRVDELKSVFDVLQERMDDEIINPPAVEAKVDEMTQFAIEGARNMQDAFADFLFDPFDKGMSGMLESFGNTIKRMLANAAASQILGALFGSEFGKTGEIGGVLGGVLGDIFKGASGASGSSGGSESAIMSAIYGIGNIAGSFFAEGGRPTLGKLAVVGERGPELFVPDTAGEIIPTEAMAGFLADRIATAHSPVPPAGGRNGPGPQRPADSSLWKLLKGMKLAGFAEGGRPPLGKLSMVGEHGPELFAPDTAGSIFSTEAMGHFLTDRAPAGHAPTALDSGRIPALHAPAAAMAIQPVSVQNNHSSQVTIQVRGEDTPRSRQSSQQLAADIARQIERARIRNG